MLKDKQYLGQSFHFSGIEHDYGSNVHLFQNNVTNTLLAKLCDPKAKQPQLNTYVQKLYEELLRASINKCLPTKTQIVESRMKEFTAMGEFEAELLDPDTRALTVNIARAGTWPSHTCFEELNYILSAENIRQDHFFMNRKTNETGQVVGVDVSGSKIGGDQENAYVFFPDPMGATGASLSHTIAHYKEAVAGTAKKYIVLHLIITPEYIKKIQTDHPDVEIFSLRLDRGLSPESVLNNIPGKDWNNEKGLTDTQYIVPGAGGVGELLNNSPI
jgi:uracil phosphoribosyltransferase